MAVVVSKQWMKRTPVTLVVLGGLALLLLSSCQQLTSLIGVNQDTRLSTFFNQADQNQQSNLYTNFSSTSTTDYTNIKDPTFWTNTPFGPNQDPILGSYPSPINGTSVSGNFTSEGGIGFTFSATFLQSGSNWFFETFTWTQVTKTSNTYTIKVIK